MSGEGCCYPVACEPSAFVVKLSVRSSLGNQTPSSFKWSTDTKRYIVLFGVVLLGLAIYRFNFLIGPLAISLLLAYLLNPLMDFVQERLHFRRAVGAMVLLWLVLVLLILVSILLVQSVLVQLQSLQLDLDQISEQISDFLAHPLEIGNFTIDVQQLFDQLRSSISSFVQPLIDRVLTIGADVAQGLIWLIFIFISSFYFMKDAHTINLWLVQVMPAGFRDDFILLRARVARTWSNFFRGQLVLAITMGFVVGLSMWAIGLPNALIIGVLFGVLEVVPNFGPVIASVPTILIALFQGSTWLFVGNNIAFAIVVVILSFLLQQIENVVLVPRILGHHLNLYPIAVLLAVIAGASLAGVLGILLASPVLATIRDIVRYIMARLQDRPPFPEHDLVNSA